MSGIGRDVLDQVRHLVRPLAIRIANTFARGVVRLVDDTGKMQRVQLVALDGETIDGAEHVQPYGFSSVALPGPGTESFVVFPGGDRAHPIVIAVTDRALRPTDRPGGEVTIYNERGAKVILRGDSPDVEIQPGPGGQVLVREEGGTVDRLVRKSDHDGHTHPAGTLVAPSGGGAVTGVTGGAPAVTGTSVLRA